MSEGNTEEQLQIQRIGDPAAKIAVLQPVAAEDFQEMQETVLFGNLFSVKQASEKNVPGKNACLIYANVRDWNSELSPWEAPPVFGREGFGKGADHYLQQLEEQVIRPFEEQYGKKEWYLAGYSLAGLFALWAATRKDIFRKVAAVSPSVWFPGWLDYVREHPLQTGAVYLSLGRKEEKAKNPVMATVGDCIRSMDDLLKERQMPHILEWNEGNHFQDYEGRMARAFHWLLQEDR
ncbi:MAG: esterase [Lachnospiraceae bacterium]|nr:esterase [Lachnospiraceae bacterium]